MKQVFSSCSDSFCKTEYVDTSNTKHDLDYLKLSGVYNGIVASGCNVY